MLIIALVLAVIGLAALVFAVVTSNELVAWICIAASVLGVVLLIIDALQERQRRAAGEPGGAEDTPHSGTAGAERASGGSTESALEDYPEESDEKGGAEEVSSPPVESGAGASAEPGGSDEYDHGTADQGAVGEDKGR